jgi:chromosome segregation ATPase
MGALKSTAMAISTDLADAKRDISSISEGLPSIQKAIDWVDRALPTISSSAVSIASDFQDIKEDIHKVQDNMQRYEERLAILPFIQERIDTLPSCFTSSIMQQLEGRNRERLWLPTNEPESTEILSRIDNLVRIQ